MSAMSDDKVREMFDACTRRLDDYHFVQCMRKPRCTCGLDLLKAAIRDNFDAAHEAGMRAGIERAAGVIATEPVPPGAFGLREKWCAAIRALLEGKP